MAAFPAAKLGALLLKQVSKPIANACKNYAKSSPFFRTYICMPPAQFYHWSEVKMKMWILNLGKPVNIPVLNEQQAIELGANLLGEGVIFTIAALILIAEYNRQSAKEAKKEAARIAEKQHLEDCLQELYFTTQKQATQINELMRLVYDLEGRTVQVPWKSSKKPSEDPPQPPPAPQAPSFIPSARKSETVQTQAPSESNYIRVKDLQNRLKSNYFVTCAYDFVENDLFPDQEYSPSIVNLGISHLYNNVYRIPMST